MDIVQWSPDELRALGTHLDPTIAKTVPSGPEDKPEEPGFVDTALATLQRENLTVQLAQEMGRRQTLNGSLLEEDPNWNPYRYMRENWDEPTRQGLDSEIRLGLFDGARNAGQLDIKRQQLQQEKALMDTMSRGSGWGVTLGGLGAALTDLTTYIPVGGEVARVRQAGRVGQLLGHAATSALQVGLQETGLHQLEDLRTAQETYMNIGVAGALGAGMGAFARTLHPDHPLYPSNPLNPMHPDNMTRQGVGVRTVDGGEDIIAHSDFAGSTAGAAQVGGEVINKEKGLLDNSVGKYTGLQWLGEKLTGTTPVGRALQWTGDKSRSILTSMMDMGGVLTDTNRFGIATRASAEDLKNDMMVSANNLGLFGDRQLQLANTALGQSSVGQMFRGMVKPEQFNEIARKHLLSQWTDADNAALVRQYGEEGAAKITAHANGYAEKIHETNAFFEGELKRIGKVRDTAKVDSLAADLKSLRAQRDAAKAQAAAASDADTVDLTDVNGKIDSARAELLHQMSLPAPLGREYGHAQMYDSHSIMSKEAAFRDWLLDALVDHPDADWLHDRYGLTLADFEKLGKEPLTVYDDKGVAKLLEGDEALTKRQEVLQDWSGDDFYHRLSRAEAKHDAAQAELSQSKLDFLDTMRALGEARNKVTALRTSEARKFRDKTNAELEQARAARDEANAEYETLVKGAEASRTKTLTRQQQLNPTVSDVKTSPLDKLTATLVGEEPVKPATAPKEPKVETTVPLARSEERATAAGRKLALAERRLAEAEGRATRVNTAYNDVMAKLAAWDEHRGSMAETLVEARKARGIAAKDAKSARRELLKARKATPLDDVVSDIRSTLMDRTTLPSGIMEHNIQTTGRLKERRINLTPEQRLAGEEQGFLRTDLPSILHSQYQKLSGYIGLHDGLDIGKGKTFETWADVHRAIDEEYDTLTRNGAGRPQAALNAERMGVHSDADLLKDRLLGTEDTGVSRDSWTYWLSQKARQANFARFGAGFLLPSLTDVASVSFRSGSIAKLFKNHGAEIIKIMRSMDPTELQAFVNGQELGHAGLRLARGLDVDDARNMAGIGMRGTVKHDITSAIDRGFNWVGEKTPVVSGLRAWTRFWKIAAGVHRTYKLRDMTARFGELKEKEVADLASLGIGRHEAERINAFAQQFGKTDERGHWDPNFAEWQKSDQGRAAARDFRIAVQRDMNRAVFTPGIGDTPGIMSKWYGKLLGQFQTFAFAFMNRYMTPMSQRLATYKDGQAVASLAWLAASSMAVMLGKDVLNQRDPSKRLEQANWGNTAKELIDRSGMTSFLSPYIDSALKLSSPVQERAFGHTIVGPTDRFSRNGWAESMLGSSMGLFNDIQKFGSSVSQGESSDKMLKKGMVLAPFNFYWRLGHALATDPQP